MDTDSDLGTNPAGESRRSFLKKMVAVAFAAPAISTFALDSLASANTFHLPNQTEYPGHFPNQFQYHPNQFEHFPNQFEHFPNQFQYHPNQFQHHPNQFYGNQHCDGDQGFRHFWPNQYFGNQT